ncbi:MAG: asparagine--tRNA ligase [Thermoplasmata archaeon]|nr:MAG: asparagine--tRNA ligase [Thermoplasmata archaeon]
MEPIGSVLEGTFDDREVSIRGWVYRTRSSGSLAFVTVRDSTGVIQAVASKKDMDEQQFDALKRALIESSVEVTGRVNPDERAPGGRELHVTTVKVVHAAEDFPIYKDKSEEYLLDVRHLWLRSREMTATLKLRSTVISALRDYYLGEGYYESQGPMFVGGQVEGGSTLFEVPYFERKVFLTQSSQLYLEALIFGMEKVFTLAPSFRAEKSRTRRHVTEFWHFEIETAWVGNDGMMDIEEETIRYVARRVMEDRGPELEVLGRDLDALRAVEEPFPRMRYDEAVETMQANGASVEWGDDFGYEEEKALTKDTLVPIHVHHFPRELKAFYHRPDPTEVDRVLNHDLIAPVVGEIIGGGERIWELEVLLDRIDAEELDREAYQWYIDLRRFGSVPHSGYGMGVDRVVQWLGGIEHIKWALPFPRDRRRIYP